MALEGVRGLAAIVVVLHHFLLAFYPLLIFGPGSIQHMRFEDNIHGTPLALLFAGAFAVSIFFVLSGFVLTVGFFQTKSESIIKKLAAKRYLRLMLPALAITMVCFILMKLGFPQHIAEAAEITGSSWLGTGWSFDAHFLSALYSGTIGIFIEGGSAYDNVLWTMTTEFIGSFIVFAFVLLCGRSRYRWLSYAGVIILTFNTWFLPFIIGVALADLYVSGRLELFRKKRFIAIALAGAVLFGAYPIASVQTTMYAFASNQLPANITVNYQVLYLTIGASLLIFAVLMSKRITSWLERQRVSILGKYTFSLYLVHLPVLYTTGMLTFLALHSYLSYNMAVLLTLLINIPVIALVTVLFERYIDAPAIRFSGVVARAFESGEGLSIRWYALRVRRRVRGVQATFSKKPTETTEEIPVE